jgi:hypothetical protein
MYVSLARHHSRRAPKILLFNMELNVDIPGTVGVEDHFNCWRGIRARQMDNVVEYNRRGAITNASVGSGSGGGGVDDILKRLGNLETNVSELRSEVSALSAAVSYLATASSVSDVRTEIAGVRTEIADVRSEVTAISAIIPHLATKADLEEVKTAIADVKTHLASKETAMIKWIIATVLTTAGLVFTLAKFVH